MKQKDTSKILIKGVIKMIDERILNFSKITGAINEDIAFGNKMEKEVKGYNQALFRIKSALLKIK